MTEAEDIGEESADWEDLVNCNVCELAGIAVVTISYKL
jgi:hypothetical protein